MKAWLLDGLGGPFKFDDVPLPSARPGSVVKAYLVPDPSALIVKIAVMGISSIP